MPERVSYRKLWHKLIDKGIKKTHLIGMIHVGGTTIAKLSKGMPVSPRVLKKIATALDCQPGDLYEYKEKSIKQTHV